MLQVDELSFRWVAPLMNSMNCPFDESPDSTNHTFYWLSSSCHFWNNYFFKIFKEIVRFQLKSIWIDDLHQVGLYCNKFSDDRSRDLQSGKPRFHPEMKSEWRHRRRRGRRSRHRPFTCPKKWSTLRQKKWSHRNKKRRHFVQNNFEKLCEKEKARQASRAGPSRFNELCPISQKNEPSIWPWQRRVVSKAVWLLLNWMYTLRVTSGFSQKWWEETVKVSSEVSAYQLGAKLGQDRRWPALP